MASDDWAIVCGISRYPNPGFGNLDGPELDAKEFADWLRNPHGGDIPDDPNDPDETKRRIALIVSSQFPEPALPTRDAFEDAVDHLVRLADANNKAHRGFRVGRRLYLYFSGHGYVRKFGYAALFMANASKTALEHHIVGRAYAEWFHLAGLFDEVVLLMDCCQTRFTQPENPVHLAEKFDSRGFQNREMFVAYGSIYGRTAREKVINGRPRGVFTEALIEGLKGDPGAWDAPPGTVTHRSLSLYLRKRMPELLSQEEREDSAISSEPDIPVELKRILVFVAPNPTPNPAVSFAMPATRSIGGPEAMMAFAPSEPEEKRATFHVRFQISDAHRGKPIRIEDGKLALVKEEVPRQSPWVISLPPGLYTCSLPPDTREVLFHVKPSFGGTDVDI